MRGVIRAGQHFVEEPAGGIHPVRAGVFGADQPIPVAAVVVPLDQHHVGQQLGDLDRVDVGAARHGPAGGLAAPVKIDLFQPRIGEGQGAVLPKFRADRRSPFRWRTSRGPDI